MSSTTKISAVAADPHQATHIIDQLNSKIGPTLKGISEEKLIAIYKLFGISRFLGRWCQHHPQLTKEIITLDWNKTWSQQDFEQDLGQIITQTKANDKSTVFKALSSFKYRHLFRIAARDIGLNKTFSKTAYEISLLANTIIQYTLLWHRNRLELELGNPIASELPIQFCVLAMGKLGGMELNFSSDIDLIYLYSTDNGYLDNRGTKGDKTPHQFFCALGVKLGQFLNQRTADGFLYRVDLELRPEGKSGTLANSLDAMEKYYESFGAFWEKQAMIKLNLAAGSVELFQQFRNTIQPFVFPKTSDYTFINKIREMKEKVHQSIKGSSDSGYHVKLGKGGIREIEFFTQSLQILFAGLNPELQIQNTLLSIQQLAKFEFIKEDDAVQLKAAYVFLRTLENRLQQIEEQQTHRLPKSEDDLTIVARSMGYLENSDSQNLENFQMDLEKHRRFSTKLFDSLISEGLDQA